MLSVKNLTKVYKTKQGVTSTALDDLTFDFDRTGLVFILGKSGSGKSTLLNILGGLDQPTHGELIVNGRSSKDFSTADFDGYRNTFVGFVFQEYNLIDAYTVGDNVALATELQGQKITHSVVDSVLRLVDLTDNKGNTLFHRKINELSGGQKQRVAIARALIKEPKIILADEPTGALDSKTGTELYELLKKLSQEKLIIVVSHDRECALRYGDRIIELSDGKIICDSVSGDEISNQASIDCNFTKSKLPFKRIFSMGVHGLSTKPLRLAISILLSVIAFSLFGFSFVASMTNAYRTELKMLDDNGLEMVMLKTDNQILNHSGWSYLPLTSKQLDIIGEYNDGKDPMVVFSPGSISDWSKHNLGETNDAHLLSAYCQLGLVSGTCIEIDPISGYEDANLRPDARFQDKDLCCLPQSFNEVAITDLHADMFMRFGYRSEDGTIINIRTPDELIGKRLGDLTICGVYSTELDKEYFKKFDDISMRELKETDTYNYNIVGSCVNSGISYLYIKKGYSANILNGFYDRIYIKLSENIHKNLALLNKLNYSEEESKKSVEIMSPYSEFMFPLYFFRDYLLLPCQIGAAVFAVFASLLLMNFLNVSLDHRRKEFGILRALGARKKDILGICLSESGIIAFIDFILSLVAVIIISGVLNSIYFIPLFIVRFVPVVIMLAICLGVAAVSTIIPVVKLTRKRPIDIIDNK